MRAPAIDPRATRCPDCGRRIATTVKPDCPTRLPMQREVERTRRMFGLDTKEKR